MKKSIYILYTAGLIKTNQKSLKQAQGSMFTHVLLAAIFCLFFSVGVTSCRQFNLKDSQIGGFNAKY